MLGSPRPTRRRSPRRAIEDCADCPASKKYDSEEVIEKIRNIKRSVANEAPIDLRAGRRD